MKRTLVLTENISEPVDEGMKKFSYQLAKYIAGLNNGNQIFSSFANNDIPNIKRLPKNKIFFSISFFRRIFSYNPQLLVYVPSSSTTLMSFIRLAMVSLFCREAKKIMFSLQERKHNYISKKIISVLKPDHLVVLSTKEAIYYQTLGLQCIVSPIGVESEKFKEITLSEKQKLRLRLKLPVNCKIALHVGHINKGRNLEILKGLISKGYTVAIVASTRFESDMQLKAELEKIGYIFITDYIENIEEYYQTSDIYVFPVLSSSSAMEFPMSVLEAMSCNLAVMTTRFGGIESFLTETSWFKYFLNEKELMAKIDTFPLNSDCSNRQVVLSKFSWDNVFDNLFLNIRLAG